jgi:hypothetical protein
MRGRLTAPRNVRSQKHPSPRGQSVRVLTVGPESPKEPPSRHRLSRRGTEASNVSANDRQFMVGGIQHVTACLVASGAGWLDAAPETEIVDVDILIVNQDGFRSENGSLVCLSQGQVPRAHTSATGTSAPPLQHFAPRGKGRRTLRRCGHTMHSACCRPVHARISGCHHGSSQQRSPALRPRALVLRACRMW